jgi:uncharacterized membrane protein YfcA
LIDSAVLIITLGSFVAAFVNGAFATGGIYIMLFASVSVLPISAAVPLQPAFAVASLSARIYLFWQHIDWRIVRLFALGSGVGVILGTRTFVALPEEIIVTLLGFIMLALIWMPKVNWQVPIKHPFLIVGVIHSYLGAIFGVGGGATAIDVTHAAFEVSDHRNVGRLHAGNGWVQIHWLRQLWL